MRVAHIVLELVVVADSVFDCGGERERVELAVGVFELLILAVPVGLAVVVLDEVIVAVEVLVVGGVRDALEVNEKDEEELEVFDAGADLVNEGDADWVLEPPVDLEEVGELDGVLLWDEEPVEVFVNRFVIVGFEVDEDVLESIFESVALDEPDMVLEDVPVLVEVIDFRGVLDWICERVDINDSFDDGETFTERVEVLEAVDEVLGSNSLTSKNLGGGSPTSSLVMSSGNKPCANANEKKSSLSILLYISIFS